MEFVFLSKYNIIDVIAFLAAWIFFIFGKGPKEFDFVVVILKIVDYILNVYDYIIIMMYYLTITLINHKMIHCNL